MKKRMWIYSVACLILGVLFVINSQISVKIPELDKTGLWVAKRPLPEKIALNAYLKGNAARNNHDLKQAIDAYIQVLEYDPKNLPLLHETYTLAMLQGTPDLILPYLDTIPTDKLLVDYLRVANAFKNKQFDKAFSLLQNKKKEEYK